MAGKYPYTSGSGNLIQVINHFRKSFPAEVTASTLKKLGIASNNESLVINILRFINLLDEKGKKTSEANVVFTKHVDSEFQEGMAVLVKKAYEDLFLLYGDETWELPTDNLVSFFRSSDKSSDVVGKRQANAFQILANLSGRRDITTQKQSTTPKSSVKKVSQKAPANKKGSKSEVQNSVPLLTNDNNVGLTVRIEINLPAVADQETYDQIFRSIRTNLLNEK